MPKQRYKSQEGTSIFGAILTTLIAAAMVAKAISEHGGGGIIFSAVLLSLASFWGWIKIFKWMKEQKKISNFSKELGLSSPQLLESALREVMESYSQEIPQEERSQHSIESEQLVAMLSDKLGISQDKSREIIQEILQIG